MSLLLSLSVFAFFLLLLGAFVFSLLGFIQLVIAAFRESVIWGLGVLLSRAVALVFICLHFQKSKKALKYMLIGLGLGVLALLDWGILRTYFHCIYMI